MRKKRRNDRISIQERHRLKHHVLNFGLGVQSTAMVLMCLKGILPKPTAIIFADPHWEVSGSYENLDRIHPMVAEAGIPFHIVTAGDIREDSLELNRIEMPFFINASRYITIEGKLELLKSDVTKAWRKQQKLKSEHPSLFDMDMGLEETLHHACTEFGKKVKAGEIRSGWEAVKTTQIGRQCTEKYKINAVMKFLRKNYGASLKNPIGQWLGITTDEFTRMRTSPVKASVLMYPLIDLGLSREDCETFLNDEGFPIPPKSACIGCPYHSEKTWSTLGTEDLEEVADFEEDMIQMIASNPKLRNLPYLSNGVRVHRSMIPIDELTFSKEPDSDDSDTPCASGCFL